MNINNIATATTPSSVETIPFESKSSPAVSPEPSPNEITAPSKTRPQISEDNRQSAVAKEEQKNSLSAKDAKQLAAEMNEIMDDLQTRLGFSIREDLNHQVIIEIKDRETNELIKQIPSEEMLAIKEKMEEFSGLIFDQKV